MPALVIGTRRCHYLRRCSPTIAAHETAIFAANISLVYYEDAAEFAQGTALCDELGKDKAFLERDEYVKQRCDRMVYVGLNDRAKKCELAADKSGNFDQYVECGNLFRDVYDADPEAKEADKLLWNAGIQYEKGKAIGLAIAAFSQLHKDFLGKKSEWAQKAIRKMGENYAAIAWYDKASEQYELYAQKYAGEADAKAALNDAVFFRKGIGDDSKAIENTNDYAKRFGAKNPKEAASAFFSIYSIYEKQGNKDKVISHLREYIGKWGSKGTTDLTVIAYGKIGDIYWNDSCSVPTVDGTCAKVQRSRALASASKKKKKKKGALPQRCTESGGAQIDIVARDPRKLKDAVSAYSQAIAAYDRVNGKTGGDEASARFYYARAKIALADIDYEKSLAIKFPNMEFSDAAGEAKAVTKLKDWKAAREKATASAIGLYKDAVQSRDPFNAIAAVARIAQIKLALSDALFTAQIPPYYAKGGEDAVYAYCDFLDKMAADAKFVEEATTELAKCLETSRELGFFNNWSAICERELGQLKPNDYPTASEIRSESGNVAPVVAGEAAVLKL
ncbi:MAG: hypothetical protein IPL79_06690 [Myxococcales bacterium]|nr:hypothetical protein [Myxococcales bacterium]